MFQTKVVDKIKTHILCSITAFPLKQWLRERTSMLRYTYIACLVTAVTFSVLYLAKNVGRPAGSPQ